MILFTGPYQLEQVASFLAEMLNEHETLDVKFLIELRIMLRVEVRSRHINSKTYKCYIEYTPNLDSVAGVKRYYGECVVRSLHAAVDARTECVL